MKQITMSDIALKSGFCQATVSLALRNHPSIPASTAQRIQKIAKSIGYRPHPFVSALMAERRRTHKNGLQALIAILSPFSATEIQKNSYLQRFHGTLTRYASLRGFKAESFHVQPSDDEGASLDQILYSRGVSGIILSDFTTHLHPFTLTRFQWERYSIVRYGHHQGMPLFHQVNHDIVTPFRKLLQQIRLAGFKNPGLFLDQFHVLLSQNYWSMVFRDFMATSYRQYSPKILIEKEPLTAPAIRQWIQKSKIDSLLVCDPANITRIQEKSPPATLLPFFTLNLPQDQSPMKGIWNHYEAIAQSAIDLLEGLLLRNERGIPETPCQILQAGKIVFEIKKTLSEK